MHYNSRNRLNRTRVLTATLGAALAGTAAGAAFLSLSGGRTEAAQQQQSVPRHPPRPVPPRPGPPLPLPRPLPAQVAVKTVTVNAVVRDGVAETEVSHVFENRSDAPQEGDFVFPIPDGASVSSFAMYDGETKLDARLLDKDEATHTYEEIVRRKRDPALLTFQGRAALRARVFPIAPRATRKLTMKLVTVLPREGDARKFAWTLVGPHLPGAQQRPEQVTVRVEFSSGQGGVGNVYSPTHDVGLRRVSDARVVATWESKTNDPAALSENPEFDLYLTPKTGAGSVALSMLTYNASLPQVASLSGGARQSGYFLVVASPAVTDPGKAALPRRVVMVMDRSGSMQGKKIEQAKNALKFALGKLRPQDSFNVLTFSDAVETFAPEPVSASAANVQRANAFVDEMTADGGTNIHDGLNRGLAQFPERGSGNTLLFFTDGRPTVGVRDQDAIVKAAVAKNGKKARAFVFGVGYDVDVPFLDSVGQSLRGDADYVRPDEDIEVKTSRFVAKTSAPVLENLKLTVGGGTVGEIYPKPGELPDLFAGSQLVLVGRYTGASQKVKLTLSGEANGKPQSYSLPGKFPAVDTDAAFLPRLWASRKIGYLMDDLRLRDDGDVKKEIVEQIVALSKEYGILTPYTAMFVPEPGQEVAGRRADGIDRIISNDADNSLLFGGSRGGGAMKGAPAGAAGGFGGAAASSPVPVARSGEAAVNASQGARSQRAANQVGNYNVYALKAGAEKERDEALSKRIQNVAARTFYQVGPVWQDATFDAKKQKEIVKVKLYSPAYFALTRRNAAFAKWAALGDQVLITANATQAVQFSNEGKENLTDKELDALAGKG